jgi:hypothetical protein
MRSDLGGRLPRGGHARAHASDGAQAQRPEGAHGTEIDPPRSRSPPRRPGQRGCAAPRATDPRGSRSPLGQLDRVGEAHPHQGAAGRRERGLAEGPVHVHRRTARRTPRPARRAPRGPARSPACRRAPRRPRGRPPQSATAVPRTKASTGVRAPAFGARLSEARSEAGAPRSSFMRRSNPDRDHIAGASAREKT